MGVDDFSPHGDEPYREIAIYSLTTDPEYIYLIDPNPDVETHIADRCQGWSLRQRYAVLRYGLEPQGDPFDAYDPDNDQHVEIKSCCLEQSTGRRGEFEFYSGQHHRLKAVDGDYIFIVYSQPDEGNREPNAAKWVIHAHARISADDVHKLFDSDFKPVLGRVYHRKRCSWGRILSRIVELVKSRSTTDYAAVLRNE